MIKHPAFAVEPWQLRETALDTDLLAQTESVFALSNGHIGWRGNLDEGEPHALAGSYLNGVYEQRPLPYAEAGYGDPESGQTVINVTNGKIIRLLVDDEPFDVRYGDLHAHERVLDFRAGTLRRTADWSSPSGRTVRVTSTRIVSFTQRAVAAICYEVEPLDRPARVVVQSELVANEEPTMSDGDPRAAAVLRTPLRCEQHEAVGNRALLLHSTNVSGLRMAAAMDHEMNCTQAVRQDAESREDLGRLTIATLLRPGQRLRVVKYICYGWSATRSLPALRDQVEAGLTAALQTGWEGLLADQRTYLDEFWGRADVELDGDDEIQQAVRFGLFHVLQAGARAEGRGIPAKGLTGPGYDGHAFWDTEGFVLPVLTFGLPAAAAHALRWRQEMIPQAMERARQLKLRGAAFPWRTISGAECSGYWPAGTGAFHVNADIADAVIRYVHLTDDRDFEAKTGVGLLVQTARLWQSLGHFDTSDRFRIDGVTGPDEYSAICDNNIYTNLMAQQNLAQAASAAERHPERARELDVSAQEIAEWRRAAAAVLIPFDEKRGVHPQAEGFTEHQVWDFAATGEEQYPLLRHFAYFDLYRKQVVKQADLVLAMHMFPDAFTAEQKVANFEYYEPLTVRDSSLSACSQAVIAAETGHLDLAYDYLGEAALMDLEDLEHNTRDGLHIASLAGAWIVLVDGFGGRRMRHGKICFAPRLPRGLTRLAFTISARGRRLHVEIYPDQATYLLRDEGEPLELQHHGEPLSVTSQPQSRPIPAAVDRPRPSQPPGREPRRRADVLQERAQQNGGSERDGQTG